MAQKIKLVAGADLSKLIGSIGKAKVKLDAAIQVAAVSCIAQSVLHRNVTPANELYDVLSKSHRRDSLLMMFEKFGHMAWSKVEGRILFDKVRADGAKAVQWNDKYAESLPMWYDAKKEPAAQSVYDFDKEFEKFLERASQMAKKVPDFRGRDLLNAAVTARASFIAAKALREATQDTNLVKDEESTNVVPIAA